jgi:hypothetical protein
MVLDLQGRRSSSLQNMAVDASTELVPPTVWGPGGASVPTVRLSYTHTLASPDTIAVDASEQRANVATRANVLSPALDAAKTAGAANSIEKMLCHQIATAHMVGMELMVKVSDSQFLGKLPVADHVRLTNAAARLFDVFQAGCLTLQKLQTGGRSGSSSSISSGQRLARWAGGGRSEARTGITQPGERAPKWPMNPMRHGADG